MKEYTIQLVIRFDPNTDEDDAHLSGFYRSHPNHWDWRALLDMPESSGPTDEGLVSARVINEISDSR